MPTLGFRTADCSAKTSKFLRELLAEQGVKIVERDKADGIVCYGWGSIPDKKNVLNAHAGEMDNLEQLQLLKAAGVSVPPFAVEIQEAARLQFPLLGRTRRHIGGEGIRVVFQPEELDWRAAAGSEYFTQHIPIDREYRVWVYRRRILAVYDKIMQHPEQFRGVGRNFKDGFWHEYVRTKWVDGRVLDLSARAVHAMNLDFGGVDVIVSKSAECFVLEVNSAPGTFYRTGVGINKLAKSIVRWMNAGFPKRATEYRGVEDAE